MSGVLAHFLGVAFNTPMIARSFPARIRVEILGKVDLDSALMAVAMGEKFSAQILTQRIDITRVLTVVTVNGLTEDQEDRDFVARTGAPIVNLTRLQTEQRGGSAPDSKIDSKGASVGSELFYINSAYEALRIAEACRIFATALVRDDPKVVAARRAAK